jgi:PAS domain S-box-containing protein
VVAADGKAERALGVFGDITARKRREQGWKEERDRLYALFEEAPGLVAVVQGPDHVFRLANKAYRELVGQRELVGKPVREALPELEPAVFERIDRVYATGEPFIGVAVPGRLQRGPGEELEERYFDFVYQPIREADGSISGIFHQGFDVTERVLFLRQQKLLLDELNHRVKNNLATVQAIAHQTARHAPDLPAFRKTFESRLIALSRTHDVLTAGAWESADLQALLQGELGMYGENRVRLEGPPVALSSRQALSLGLVVHELATNAAKYGALSHPENGCVRVSWRLEGGDGAQRLHLLWREQEGPPVTPPASRGFGSQLIERGVRELGGAVSNEWDRKGVVCRINVPL